MSGVLNFSKDGKVGVAGQSNIGMITGNPDFSDLHEEPSVFPLVLSTQPKSINSPFVFTDFRNTDLWFQIVHSAYFTHTFSADGKLTILGVGPVAGSDVCLFSGIVYRKGILPDPSGLIDIAFSFDTCNMSHAPANNKNMLVAGLSYQIRSGGVAMAGMGVQADDVFSSHASYCCRCAPSLDVNASLNSFGTASANMATHLDYFRCRFQIRNMGAPIMHKFDPQAATYEHNGGAAVALGGGVDSTGWFGNCYAGLRQGLTLHCGMWSALRNPGANLGGRLVSIEILAGTLLI
jgi:hypothetical protein